MEMDKIYFGSARTSDEKIEELARIRQYLRSNSVDEKVLIRLQELAEDNDPDIRCEVAFCLPFIETKELRRFTHMINDRNAFVASRASAAINQTFTKKRSEELRRLEEKSLRGIEYIKKQYGEDVARVCTEIIENLYAEAVGYAAHDLRGAVSYLDGEEDIIYSACVNELPAQKRNRVNRAHNNFREKADITYRILDDMKTYARKNSSDDRMPENLSVLLKSSITQAVTDFSSFVGNADEVKVVTDIPESLSVFVSSVVIQRAFSNLVKNAMESYLVSSRKTKPGTVEVSAEKVQDGARIVIRDYGAGFSKHALTLARSFLPRSTSKKMTGSGFGLAIAYSKIKHHGGQLTIESAGLDQGTTVTVFLPSKGEK